MTSGVVYVAYGLNYNYQAAFSARSVREHSDLPICVFTNVGMHDAWAGISDVSTVMLDEPNEANRAVKTALHEYSPFERTLYLDADTLVLKPRFALGFAMLDTYDIMGVPEGKPVESAKGVKVGVYWKVHKALGYTFPLTRINGGVLFFRKGALTTGFFALWNACWKQMGSGRDMPALAWALQQLPALKVRHLKPRWNCPRPAADTIIAHALGTYGIEGIPRVVKLIPNMHGDPTWRKRGHAKAVDLEVGVG